MEVAADWVESFPLCQRYYKENGLSPADPLPGDATPPDRQQLDAEPVLSGMLSAVFALVARSAVTKQVLDQWRASAKRRHSAAALWLAEESARADLDSCLACACKSSDALLLERAPESL